MSEQKTTIVLSSLKCYSKQDWKMFQWKIFNKCMFQKKATAWYGLQLQAHMKNNTQSFLLVPFQRCMFAPTLTAFSEDCCCCGIYIANHFFPPLNRNFPWQSSAGQNATADTPPHTSHFTTAWTGCSVIGCRISAAQSKCQERKIIVMSTRLQCKVKAVTSQFLIGCRSMKSIKTTLIYTNWS